jgi:hypothetical protein
MNVKYATSFLLPSFPNKNPQIQFGFKIHSYKNQTRCLIVCRPKGGWVLLVYSSAAQPSACGHYFAC